MKPVRWIGRRISDMDHETRVGLGAGCAFFLVVGFAAFCIWAGVTFVSTQGGAQTAATAAAHASKNTNTLLLNGKTSSAISAKKTERIAEEIQAQQMTLSELITNGKTAGAQQSKAAATLAARAISALQSSTAELSQQLATNHATSSATNELTQKILCRGAEDAHPDDPVIKRLCSSVVIP